MTIPRHQGSRDLFYPLFIKPEFFGILPTRLLSTRNKHLLKSKKTSRRITRNMRMFKPIHADVLLDISRCFCRNVRMNDSNRADGAENRSKTRIKKKATSTLLLTKRQFARPHEKPGKQPGVSPAMPIHPVALFKTALAVFLLFTSVIPQKTIPLQYGNNKHFSI